MIIVWALILRGALLAEGAGFEAGGSVGGSGGTGFGMNANIGGNGYWCQSAFGANVNVGPDGNGGYGGGGGVGFGRRRRGVGVGGSVGYGGYGANGNVQFDGGWQPPQPGCCYYWDPSNPGQLPQKCEGDDGEQSTEATEAPEECLATYCHKLTFKRSTIHRHENEYSDMGSDYAHELCNEQYPCNFTWSQEIPEDTDLKIRWGFFVNFLAPTDPPKFCDAAKEPVGSTARSAFDLVTRFTTTGVDACPIPTGTLDVPTEVDYTFQTDDKIMCGTSSSIKIFVFYMKDNKEVFVVNMDLNYELPEGDNCTPRAEVESAFMKSLRKG